MQCPTDSKKQYIIPTKNWLAPIEKLITDDINTDGLLMTADFLKKERIIVKITKGENKKIKVTNNLLNNIKYNFVKTFCTFSCYEDYNKLNLSYAKNTYFCSSKPDSKDIITLELMNRYNGSLSSHEGKFALEKYISLLQQILLAQIVAFEKYGFIHNDLHLGNILYKMHNNEIRIEYMIKNKNIIVKDNVEIIISDYENSICYDSEQFIKYDENFLWIQSENKMNSRNHHDQNTLTQNIINVTNISINLLQMNNKHNLQVKQNIGEFLNSEWLNEKSKFSRKKLRSLFRKNYTYERYKRDEIDSNIIIINELFKKINNNDEEIIPYFFA